MGTLELLCFYDLVDVLVVDFGFLMWLCLCLYLLGCVFVLF